MTRARECVGTSFAHQGRRVGHGLDCGGVIVHAWNLRRDPRNYSRRPRRWEVEKMLLDLEAVEIEAAGAAPGDVIAMTCCSSGSMERSRSYVRHLAILTEKGTIVHADSDPGIMRVTEVTLGEPWISRVRGVFTWLP